MRLYRFLFDPTTGQYKGVTRDKSVSHATNEPPIFSSGHQTVWDFKGEWKLIESEIFYSQMANYEILKVVDMHMLSEITLAVNHVSKAIESSSLKTQREIKSLLMSLDERQKYYHVQFSRAHYHRDTNHHAILNILTRNTEQLRELNYKLCVLQTSVEVTFFTRLKNQLCRLWSRLSL